MKFTELGAGGKICIHALYSMLPAVFAMMYEARFPWLEDPDKKNMSVQMLLILSSLKSQGLEKSNEESYWNS